MDSSRLKASKIYGNRSRRVLTIEEERNLWMRASCAEAKSPAAATSG
jgi:hypothetical protein